MKAIVDDISRARSWLDERHRLGLDLKDGMWDGILPASTLGYGGAIMSLESAPEAPP